ncbi:MAG: amino acid permease [Leptospira sp.]|nr:amino acid permease [Leptospira sp.]NCS94735.1 amino acid permease [Leptospira sp.]
MEIHLKRSLNLKDSISILFSSMVGSGVFITTGIIYGILDSPWLVLLTWFLGAIFSMAGSFTFAKLAIFFPFAGGDYIYLKKAYSPLIAFMSGWASLLITFSASISVLGLALGEYLAFIFPYTSNHAFFHYSFLGLEIKFGYPGLVGVIAIFLFTTINYFGIHRASIFQNLLSLVKVLGLLLFSVAAIYTHQNQFQIFNPVPNWEIVFSKSPSILIAIIPVIFSYLGWNMVTYIAEEVKDPEKNISRTIIYGSALVAILYLLVNLSFLLTLSPNELRNNEGIATISSIHVFGESAKFYFSVFFCLVILGSLSATIIGGSRIYFAMARDGLFFPFLSKLHSHYKSPYNSLFFQAVYASIFIIFDLEFLLYMITCAILIMSALTAFSVFIFERRGHRAKYKIPLYPFTPILYILGCILLVIYLAMKNPIEAFSGIFILLSSIPVYLIFKKKFTNNHHLDESSKDLLH